MPCQIKKISDILKIKVDENQFNQLSADLENIMALIGKMQKIGQTDGELYKYNMSELRKDISVNMIEKGFNPMLNAKSHQDNMFVVDGVIDDK